MGAIELMRKKALMVDTNNPYIQFEDEEVQRVLMANGVGDGIGITPEQLAGLTSIDTWFAGNTTIKSFKELAQSGVRELVRNSFRGCSNLDYLDISKIRILNYDCLSSCNPIFNELNMPDLTYIYALVFSNKTRLKKVLNLGSIISFYVASSAGIFQGCTSLEFVVLPPTLTDLSERTFRFCSALKTLIVENPNPPSFGWGTFDSTPIGRLSSDAHIYVPAEAVETYQQASDWSTYASIISAIPDII